MLCGTAAGPSGSAVDEFYLRNSVSVRATIKSLGIEPLFIARRPTSAIAQPLGIPRPFGTVKELNIGSVYRPTRGCAPNGSTPPALGEMGNQGPDRRKHPMQWHWRRLVVGSSTGWPAARIGLGLPRRHAKDAGVFLCSNGEHTDAIHSEPTGYADFAARFEAAKSRGWPMQMRGSPFPYARCSKTRWPASISKSSSNSPCC